LTLKKRGGEEDEKEKGRERMKTHRLYSYTLFCSTHMHACTNIEERVRKKRKRERDADMIAVAS
jgi:hypothetical protein